jgi:hypothetical protein
MDNPSSSPVSAAARIKEAEELVAAVAAVASATIPGATITPELPDIGPTDCRAPYRGDVYWTITRYVHVPASLHKTGQDLIPIVQTQLEQRGYEVTNDGPGAGFTELRGGNDAIDFSVLGPDSKPLLQFNIDTQCGAP